MLSTQQSWMKKVQNRADTDKQYKNVVTSIYRYSWEEQKATAVSSYPFAAKKIVSHNQLDR